MTMYGVFAYDGDSWELIELASSPDLAAACLLKLRQTEANHRDEVTIREIEVDALRFHEVVTEWRVSIEDDTGKEKVYEWRVLGKPLTWDCGGIRVSASSRVSPEHALMQARELHRLKMASQEPKAGSTD